MRKLISAASVNLLLFCCSCHAQAVTRLDRWEEDFATLDVQFVNRQIDPFGRLSQEQWKLGIARLRQLPIGMLTDAAIGEEIEHLLAQYHDGHIKVLPDGSTAEPAYLPAKFRWFPSGIFITGAVDPKLRGAKVIRLGQVDADSLLERIAPWVSVENDSGLHVAVSNALWNGAVLSAAKIADATGPVPLAVQLTNGQEVSVLLTPQPIASIHWETPSSVPEYRQALTPANWLKVLPDRRAVYLRYAECHDKSQSRSLARQLQNAPLVSARRIIIDLRGNEGGDSAAFTPLLDVLTSRSDKSQILVLVDRGTFSSAFRNAVELKRIGGTWIGEAPSQRPVYTGNVESFLLPYSHLQIRYTTKWSRIGPPNSPELKPDVPIQPTAEQYLEGKDPVLEYALQRLP